MMTDQTSARVEAALTALERALAGLANEAPLDAAVAQLAQPVRDFDQAAKEVLR